MVDRDGLENRCACKRTVGSNPTLSAISPAGVSALSATPTAPAPAVPEHRPYRHPEGFPHFPLPPRPGPIRAGRRGMQKFRRKCRWACADPFLNRVGRHKPQHCSGASRKRESRVAARQGARSRRARRDRPSGPGPAAAPNSWGTEELPRCRSSIPRSTPTRPTRRSGPGTRCRTGRITSPATRWSRRWTRSASTARSSSRPFPCTATTRAMRWKCRRRTPAASRIVKPVDPDDPAVADVIADWKKTPGTVGIRIMLTEGSQP